MAQLLGITICGPIEYSLRPGTLSGGPRYGLYMALLKLYSAFEVFLGARAARAPER